MMLYQISDLEHLNIFFDTKCNDLEHIKKKFHEANGKSYTELAYFMSWNGTAFQVAAFVAGEASRLSNHFIDGDKSEEEILNALEDLSIRKVMEYKVNLASRSTSPSDNLQKDAEHQFYLELYSLIQSGKAYR